MTYSQQGDWIIGSGVENGVIRDDDSAFIPADPDNVDWQDYQAWLDEGNAPNPPPPPSAAAQIADSAQSLELANAKSLAAQGRTDEALAALITLMEAQTT